MKHKMTLIAEVNGVFRISVGLISKKAAVNGKEVEFDSGGLPLEWAGLSREDMIKHKEVLDDLAFRAGIYIWIDETENILFLTKMPYGIYISYDDEERFPDNTYVK